MPRKTKAELEDEQKTILQQEETATEEPTEPVTAETQLLEVAIPTLPKPMPKSHTPFSFLNVRELDKYLSADEMQEWNSIYASYRSKSLLSGEVTGVDVNQFTVTNADTGQQEVKKILSLVIIGYRVKILIPETEIWSFGEAKPEYVARSMIGASVDYVITDIDREGEVAVGSRSMALHKKRRSFGEVRGGHQSGDMVTCKVLTVGPKKCLVECGGYDILLTQRDLSYTSIADLREEYHTGQEMQAVVKGFSAIDAKLEISVKEVNPNPFDGADRRHPIGSRRQATISGKYKGGIFCALGDKSVCLCLYSNSHFDTGFFTGDRVLIQITQFDYERELIYGRIVTKL